MLLSLDPNSPPERLYRVAAWLALFTIVYNVLEGVISVYFGITEETISLLGFGIDSFVEVVSGLGIWHMIRRIATHPGEGPDRFEQRALRITGTAFYLLAAGLLATAALNLWQGHAPRTTLWGVIIATISIGFMWLLIRLKLQAGQRLNSDAIIADAHCSRACMHFSIVLLAASAGYELTGIGGLDALGAVGIAWLAIREGREAFAGAAGKSCCACDSGSCTANNGKSPGD